MFVSIVITIRKIKNIRLKIRIYFYDHYSIVIHVLTNTKINRFDYFNPKNVDKQRYSNIFDILNNTKTNDNDVQIIQRKKIRFEFDGNFAKRYSRINKFFTKLNELFKTKNKKLRKKNEIYFRFLIK